MPSPLYRNRGESQDSQQALVGLAALVQRRLSITGKTHLPSLPDPCVPATLPRSPPHRLWSEDQSVSRRCAYFTQGGATVMKCGGALLIPWRTIIEQWCCSATPSFSSSPTEYIRTRLLAYCWGTGVRTNLIRCGQNSVESREKTLVPDIGSYAMGLAVLCSLLMLRPSPCMLLCFSLI